MAYTAAVTIHAHFRQDERISRSFALIIGTCNLSVYDTTLVAITDITKYFKAVTDVHVSNPSSNGYIAKWNSTDNAFDAYQADYSASIDGPLVECPNATNVGTFTFWAVGLGR